MAEQHKVIVKIKPSQQPPIPPIPHISVSHHPPISPIPHISRSHPTSIPTLPRQLTSSRNDLSQPICAYQLPVISQPPSISQPSDQQHIKIRKNIPKSSGKADDPSKKKVKINETTVPHQTYKTSLIAPKPKPVSHEEIDLPYDLELKSFVYQNDTYWLETTTNYIFLPDDIQNKHFEPIGKLIKRKSHKEQNKISITWFVQYDFDVTVD